MVMTTNQGSEKKMKLHPALKDPTMKFPKLANSLLDAGMVSIVIGCASVLVDVAVTGPGLAGSFGFCAVVAGFLSHTASRFVAKIKHDPDQTKSSHLKLVKSPREKIMNLKHQSAEDGEKFQVSERSLAHHMRYIGTLGFQKPDGSPRTPTEQEVVDLGWEPPSYLTHPIPSEPRFGTCGLGKSRIQDLLTGKGEAK